MNEQRLVDLETKVAFQDAQIEELERTIHTQYLAIEKLETNLRVLTDRIKNADNDLVNGAHEKPPHY